jgi:hypothetical protein
MNLLASNFSYQSLSPATQAALKVAAIAPQTLMASCSAILDSPVRLTGDIIA